MMRLIFIPLFFFMCVYVEANSLDKETGKTYYITEKMQGIKKGLCGTDGVEYFPELGESFVVDKIVTNIPKKDKTGHYDGYELIFNNGAMCISKDDFNFFKYAFFSEIDPAKKYYNKRFWIINTDIADGFYEGKCRKNFNLNKSSSLDDFYPETFYPKKRSSFVVRNYLPGEDSSSSQIEIEFDNGKIACGYLEFSESYITTENPEEKEKIIKEKVASLGIKEGMDVWLKFPMSGLSGLTKLKIDNIEYLFDTVNFVIISNSNVRINKPSIESLLDIIYLSIPNKLKKLDKKTLDAINNKNIFLGMKDYIVITSVGQPDDINKSVGPWGVHEQWVYNNEVYLYFENGLLTSWQE